MASPFVDESSDPPVRGFLHRPQSPCGDGLVLTHGAGGNSQSPLLIELGNAFADSGITVLRCDLPFRQARPKGPPSPSSARRDQEGLRRAVEVLRKQSAGRVFVGGQSYGGRQASILVSTEPSLVSGLLLLSYPLHPPGKPAQLRTAHFPQLRISSLFVQGTRDPFGSPEELQSAIRLIPASRQILQIEGAGHSLASKGNTAELSNTVLEAFRAFFSAAHSG
jgi:predicted alpha/beta-hydrolase family hydrolase